MAGLKSAAREQLGAISQLRWRVFVNSLRSIRGRLNLVSRSIAGLLVLGAGLGGGLAFGASVWALTKAHNLVWLTVMFWLIFAFWQLFPVMATAFNENLDTSVLLRFPLSYPGYFLVRLVYGALDIATALGLCWSAGILVGVAAASPRLAPWALLVILAFAGFNILLARTIFVWIEHWLSRRRSREIMGVFFLLVMIGFQTAGPILGRFGQEAAPQRVRLLAKLIPLQRFLPPGLAGASLMNAGAQNSTALFSLVLLMLYAGGVFWILNLRLRRQYRGDNPAGGEKRQLQRNHSVVRGGWKLLGIPSPMSAIFEKELRYFSRSGPMLFTLIMPLIMVFIVRGGRIGFAHESAFVFPIGAAYCLLVLTNIVYNSFGGDGGGIQFFFVSPVSFRQIAAAKNLAQLAVLSADVFILWLGIRTIYHAPSFKIMMLTLAWFLFAAPLSFTVGNLLSVYSPKRIDYSTFGRQRASETTILVSFAVQLSAIGMGALAIFMARLYGNFWIAAGTLAALSVPAIAGYFLMLSRIDRIAMERREVLTTELCRT